MEDDGMCIGNHRADKSNETADRNCSVRSNFHSHGYCQLSLHSEERVFIGKWNPAFKPKRMLLESISFFQYL
jgi:hypothetical protein